MKAYTPHPPSNAIGAPLRPTSMAQQSSNTERSFVRARGFVTDGIFPATIGLLIASSSGAGKAVIGAGMLGFKRVAVAPVSGHAADRFGERIVTASAFMIAAIGALMVAFGGVIAGALPAVFEGRSRSFFARQKAAHCRRR